jgi:hypothetical protein
MRRALCVVCGLLSLWLSACSSDSSGNNPSGAESACLARPGELPRPPQGKLPCELIPPGLSLE